MNPNIIIFGDPAIDTRFVVKLAGASWLKPFDPFRSVFETNVYRVPQYQLIHTAGIPSSRTDRSTLSVPNVLENLYSFISQFNVVHLLIYVVRTDKPTSNNFRFFYDYLCRQDAPIILVKTTHTPPEFSWFNLVLTLNGADPENDKVNLHRAITKHLDRDPKQIFRIYRFESAARGCWKLLAKKASWSLVDFRDAFNFNYKKEGWLEEEELDAKSEMIIEHIQMSLKKQSAVEQVSVEDDIQHRVDAVLSTIVAVSNVTPIPFLSAAAELIENIVETTQVCAITIDLGC